MSQTHVTNNDVISRNHRNLPSKKLTERCQENEKTVRRGPLLWLKGVLEKSTKIVASWLLARTTLVSLYSCNQAKPSIRVFLT